MALQLHWQLIVLAFLVCQTNIEVKSLKLARIINGSTATAKQFPYQVYFETYLNLEPRNVCGGVIISKRVVLTAAHCVEKEFDVLKILFGAQNISNPLETGQQRLIVNRRNVVLHPEWNNHQNINDIALIKLPADLQFDEYIQPAQLPDPNETYENQEAVLSGWGYIKVIQGNMTTTELLQYYRGNIQSNEQCRAALHQRHFFPSSYICVDTSVSTACFGDSGGPMVIGREDGNSTLVGLTSFGSLECPLNATVVYTRVSSFLHWIKKVGDL